jgi:hypothetical protein
MRRPGATLTTDSRLRRGRGGTARPPPSAAAVAALLPAPALPAAANPALRNIGAPRKQGPIESAGERSDGLRCGHGIRAVSGGTFLRGQCRDKKGGPYVSSYLGASRMRPCRPRLVPRRQAPTARSSLPPWTEIPPIFASSLTPRGAALRDQTSATVRLFPGLLSAIHTSPRAGARCSGGGIDQPRSDGYAGCLHCRQWEIRKCPTMFVIRWSTSHACRAGT